MSGAAGPGRKRAASRPADALGLAILLVGVLLAVGTALPLLEGRGPAFPRPSGAEGGGPPHRRPALDINTAGVEALQVLPGIGPVLAQRIVEERQAHGPFRAPEDLLRVRSIGPSRWERIRPLVRVAEGP